MIKVSCLGMWGKWAKCDYWECSRRWWRHSCNSGWRCAIDRQPRTKHQPLSAARCLYDQKTMLSSTD